MKLFITITALLFSIAAFAVEDGTYTCGSRADLHEATYKVKTLNLDGVQIYHLDITRHMYKNPNLPNSEDRMYKINGVANQFTDDKGTEVLVLANLTLNLENGRISCKK